MNSGGQDFWQEDVSQCNSTTTVSSCDRQNSFLAAFFDVGKAYDDDLRWTRFLQELWLVVPLLFMEYVKTRLTSRLTEGNN